MSVNVEQLRTLGQRMQAAREAAGITRRNAAQQAGFAVVTVRNLEQGATDYPSANMIAQLCRVYAVEIDESDSLHAAARRWPREIETTWMESAEFRVAVRKLHRKITQKSGEPYPPVATVDD